MVLQKGKVIIKPIGMDEPSRKKVKLQENELEKDLEIFQEHILRNCLCPLPESTLNKFFRAFQATNDLWSNFTYGWNRDRLLMLVCSVQLICETAMKQQRKGFMCPRIADLCDILKTPENTIVDYFIDFANHSDQFICFAASRALSSFFLIARTQVKERWLNQLTENVVLSHEQQTISFSLAVLKRIFEWKDEEEQAVEENKYTDDDDSSCCQRLKVRVLDSLERMKCLCVKSLESKWRDIVRRFDSFITTCCSTHESTIITFLALWQAIISVKGNLSVIDTKPFYSNLNDVVSLLSSDVSPIIWRHILDLLHEVICYGNTLSLQGELTAEPCTLARWILRNVKEWNLLDSLPYREGNGRFGGGSGDGDKPLLQKVTLLVLKALAVIVKETRCDSSDSSLASEAADTNDDMIIIVRSITEILRKLDLCVKTLQPFHPEAVLAQWAVQLFSDQDDALVESMLCCLDVTVGLSYRDSLTRDLQNILNPTVSFVQFLQTVSFDSDLLLDFLISNETCFLFYLLRLLKYICRNWQGFVQTCARDVEDTVSVLIRLRISIERLVSKELFPYNINPVLRLLTKCEQLYESNLRSNF